MRACGLLCVPLLLLALRARASPFRIFSQRRVQLPNTIEMSCYEVPMKVTALTPARIKSEAWRSQKKALLSTTVRPTAGLPLNTHEIQKRFDHLFSEGEDIVKEHAKLVQDINSLRQLVLVAPLVDEARDYDESVYHEVIETASPPPPPPPPRPTATPPPRVTKPGFPVVLVGGASQRQSVKTRPVNLVGSSASPLARHPYPFVGQSPVKPYKVCMPTMPMYTTTRRPSLWNRLLSFFPRLTG